MEGRIKYLAKNTAIFTIGTVATKFIGFFLIPLYTNVLTTTQYGTIDLVSSICTVLTPIMVLNIGESILRFCLDKDSDINKIISIGIIIYGLSLVIGLIIIPVCYSIDAISDFSILIYFYTIGLSGSELLMCWLRGREMLLQYTVGNIVRTFCVALLNILFLLVFKWGIYGYFLAYIFGAFITILYASVVGKVWKFIKISSFDKKLFIEMSKYSIVLIPNTFMWWIMNTSDHLMVTVALGAAANGIYAISYKLPNLISSVTSIFNQAWKYSAIKESGSSDEEDYNNTIFKNLIVVVMLIGISMMTFSKIFLKYYVSKEFFSAWMYVPFLVVGCVYLTLATFISTSYTVHKDSVGYLISGTLGAMLNIILNLILIPILGVFGAATATCLSYIIVFVYRLYNTKKYISYNVKNKEFIVGSIVLVVSGGLMFANNMIAQLVQVGLLVIILVFYWKTFKPIFEKAVKKFMKK